MGGIVINVLRPHSPFHLFTRHYKTVPEFATVSSITSNPFDLSDNAGYLHWRQWKLSHAVTDAGDLMVEIDHPGALRADERNALVEHCTRHNMVIYQIGENAREKALVHELGRQLGLLRLDNNLRADEDSVTSLEVRAQSGNQYIPYTNRPLSWHTDGYYNPPGQQVRAIIMHCVRPAVEGGANSLLDHEMLYIRLRDENPGFIRALSHPQAMTIPANIEDGFELRGAQSGPVFSVDAQSGRLHMRYSARKRNIEWRDDETTRAAAARITALLSEGEMVIHHRLDAGQGIICNNVLHNRTGFEDGEKQHRLMYRARYYDRVAQTGIDRVA